jgi:hypothetical protein
MPQSQIINSIGDKVGVLSARRFRYRIDEDEALLADPAASPYTLICLDADDESNQVALGSFKSLAGAEGEADGHLAASRNSPPSLKWE